METFGVKYLPPEATPTSEATPNTSALPLTEATPTAGWRTWGVCDGGMKAAEVDQGVGTEVEVGDDGSDGV